MRSWAFTSALRSAGLNNQRELAAAAGFSTTKLSQILTGKYRTAAKDRHAIGLAMNVDDETVAKLIADEIAWRKEVL